MVLHLRYAGIARQQHYLDASTRELTNRCILKLLRITRSCLRKSYQDFYQLISPFCHIRFISKECLTDGLMDTPSYRERRTHLKIV